MKLDLTIKQTATVTPQMITSMAVLQLGIQELADYIETLSNENPLVELDWPEQAASTAQFTEKLRWLRQNDWQNKSYYSGEQDPHNAERSNYAGETLTEHLKEQLFTAKAEPHILRLTVYLTELLDERGFLDESPETLSEHTKRPIEDIKEALELLQSLEPAGVGASDAQECLILQLRRMDLPDDTAERIVRDYLKHMAARQYDRIASLMKISKAAVKAACETILSLSPYPSAGFAAREPTVYTPPDLYIEQGEDGLTVMSNDDSLPKIRVNDYYLKLLEQTDDPSVKSYLSERMKQMESAVRNIDNRRSTLLRCAETVLEWQKDFFLGGQLRPMTLSDIAQEMDVHESTVSRAVKDKYIQCGRGLIAMHSLFTRNIGDNASLCGENARELLRKIIDSEDPKHPLSDEKIVSLLAAEGAEVSRRTVAKYRSELGIPAAFARKA